MSPLPKSESHFWLNHSRWLFVVGSVIAAIVALLAEGPGDFIGLILLCVCVGANCAWNLFGKPTLHWTVFIICTALVILGWTVEDPEPALFQSVLISAAVGWRVDRLSISIALLILLTLVPLLGTLGPNNPNWGWWNWSVGTAFTWTLGRVIRLLETTLTELTDARLKLMDSAAREERLRISRDVHDLVGHSLTAMLLNIRAAQGLMDSDTPSAKQALTDAELVGSNGISEIRTVLIEMRNEQDMDATQPEPLASLPDGENILQLLQQQSHISISHSGDVASLEGPLAVTVYRLLQECITNCSKYASLNSATIKLAAEPNEIILSSSNDLPAGSKAPPSLSDKTLGLISMRERVSSLGGTFSAGIEGTQWKVNCQIPRHD